jgi:hypothetical protein
MQLAAGTCLCVCCLAGAAVYEVHWGRRAAETNEVLPCDCDFCERVCAHDGAAACTAPPSLPGTAPPSLPGTAPPSLPYTALPSLPGTVPPSLPDTVPPSLPSFSIRSSYGANVYWGVQTKHGTL